MTSISLLILGQSTVDHVVPARPAAWVERPGGNGLYAAAGARLWLAPERIGLVTRAAADYPFNHSAMLAPAGVAWHVARATGEHLVEWLIYEIDGTRRALPRNAGLRSLSENDVGYLEQLLEISPTADDVPQSWRWPSHIYAAPQLLLRHEALQEALPDDAWLAVDPSPRYAASVSATELRRCLPRADALLLSEGDGRVILEAAGGDPTSAAQALREAGFAEVVLKLGARGAVVAYGREIYHLLPPRGEVRDQTGAGDSFGGAYAAARAGGHDSVEAARRGTSAAALVIASKGAEAALRLQPEAARERLVTAVPAGFAQCRELGR